MGAPGNVLLALVGVGHALLIMRKRPRAGVCFVVGSVLLRQSGACQRGQGGWVSGWQLRTGGRWYLSLVGNDLEHGPNRRVALNCAPHWNPDLPTGPDDVGSVLESCGCQLARERRCLHAGLAKDGPVVRHAAGMLGPDKAAQCMRTHAVDTIVVGACVEGSHVLNVAHCCILPSS